MQSSELTYEQSIARSFVEARRSRAVLQEYPGTLPADIASAYRIQDAALALWERPIGGWKVGRIGPPLDAQLGTDRLAGPIFADSIVDAETNLVAMPIFGEGFAAAEAEFMLRLSIPSGSPLPRSPTDAIHWVDQVRIGIEIASSPYPRINADGPCVTISDHGNNAGLALGAQVPRSRWGSLDAVQVALGIDGHVVGRGSTATMLDGPFGALVFLLRNLDERGLRAQSGWWISSGAITGVHEVSMGATVLAKFDDLGSVTATINS